MRLAVDSGKKSISEKGKLTPKVGAVIVKNGKVLGTSYRGEFGEGDYAEFTLFEKTLREIDVSDIVHTLRDTHHRVAVGGHFLMKVRLLK